MSNQHHHHSQHQQQSAAMQQYKLQQQHQQHQHHHQQQQQQQQQMQQIPLAHNGQNNHNKRRNSKVPVRELPEDMPEYQHPIYPQLYCVSEPNKTCYKWDCIILDLDRTIIHGKRLSVKRWRKYVENGTIPSLAENQCSKWHRHIHRKGHQMHPFIRGRTMIYYRPFTWHLLAVLDYLKSHFGTKIIVCTKAGEHYAASVLAALISNFTSANPDLIDDVYNFHDLHDDAEDEGKPKKPFRLICNRHDLDPKKTLIVDDNATSWFDADRKITNFWMPPCYGYQIHDIDNELQLLCKYLWDPIQQNHLKKKNISKQKQLQQQQQLREQQLREQQLKEQQEKEEELKRTKRYQEEQEMREREREREQLKVEHIQQHSQGSESNSDCSISPNSSPKREIISRQSPKSISSNTLSPKNQRYLCSPNSKQSNCGHHHQSPKSISSSSNNGNSPKNLNELQYYPQNNSLEYNQSVSSLNSSSYSITSNGTTSDNERRVSNNHHIVNHNKQNAVDKQRFSELLQQQQQQNDNNNNVDFIDDQKMNSMQNSVTSIHRISRSYKQRSYKDGQTQQQLPNGIMIIDDSQNQHQQHQLTSKRNSNPVCYTKSSSSPKSPQTKTKKKGYFFETKSRGSKKLAKIIGK